MHHEMRFYHHCHLSIFNRFQHLRDHYFVRTYWAVRYSLTIRNVVVCCGMAAKVCAKFHKLSVICLECRFRCILFVIIISS